MQLYVYNYTVKVYVPWHIFIVQLLSYIYIYSNSVGVIFTVTQLQLYVQLLSYSYVYNYTVTVYVPLHSSIVQLLSYSYIYSYTVTYIQLQLQKATKLHSLRR